MGARLASDAVMLAHLAFIAFVVAGGLLAGWRPRVAWLHLPAAAWGAWIEWSGGVCPLTPLETRLRRLAGEEGYGGGFIEHYLIPIVYPESLSTSAQRWLGAAVVAINLAVYTTLIVRRRSTQRP